MIFVYLMTAELLKRLEELQNIKPVEFTKNLEERKLEEIKHSDLIHAPKELTGATEEKINQAAKTRPVYETNIKVREYISNWIKKECEGKVVLDLACGSGEITEKVAQCNPKLAIGTELAHLTVKSNQEKIAKNFSNVYFILDDCENSSLPDNCADIIICSGMLHHVDIKTASNEIKRLLKKDGKMLAIEALKYNPVFNWYRKRTPEARTHWEAAHILGLEEAHLIAKKLKLTKIKYWQLLSILSIFFPKIIQKKILHFFNFLDNIILSIPYIQRMAWIFTLEYEKKD